MCVDMCDDACEWVVLSTDGYFVWGGWVLHPHPGCLAISLGKRCLLICWSLVGLPCLFVCLASVEAVFCCRGRMHHFLFGKECCGFVCAMSSPRRCWRQV